ncbi:type II toxin-antitoxin system PemK/MazF family toxin [Methylobacterium sp. Leaf456]|uniref:type II toxin-antitoxin system PemK/MazF family toxin n=1 Tax=Methylobacterium sp. Leaf456 TaxID=1736382 RepID=UPI000A42D6D5|nr:type II toxin-antitoxin system PemK/MazF family toxin [Methylobacterium sp. Leaf456]
MTITFTPRQGGILMCDFGPDPADPLTFPLGKPPVGVTPELWKIRQVVVVSPAAMNHRHGIGPGVCLVVPFSATLPRSQAAWDVPFAARAYLSLPKASWAKCAAVTLVSHTRLDRVLIGRGYRGDFLSPADLARVQTGLRAAMGL